MDSSQSATSEAQPTARRRGELTAREREIVGLLAGGLSGAEIAGKLVLSPETVRTHIRNAMAKLGASTRSQAVVLALQREQIAETSEREADQRPASRQDRADRHSKPRLADLDPALEAMVTDLCALHDIDQAVVLLSEEDGLTLRRAAVAGTSEAPERLALGEGPLGRIALNRRAAVLPSLSSSPARTGTALAAPILSDGKLLGVIGLQTRTSRPAGQSELLVLQAFVNRVAEILRTGDDVDRRLESTVERFGASWSATTG